MAVAYTNTAQMQAHLGSGRYTSLLDRDASGAADTGVETQVIAEAGSLIDARLSRRYTVPFAAITDSPATPDLVQTIARHVVAHLLYARDDPNGEWQAFYWRLADGLMAQVLDGTISIPGGTEVPSEDRLRSVTVAAASPVLAGYTDDDIENGVRRSYGL